MCVRNKLTSTSGCGGTELKPSPACGNTVWSQYRVLRGLSRGRLRSVDRECAGRNALSGVKVSSPDKLLISGMAEQVCSSEGNIDSDWAIGVPGVQVHGMYTRLMLEPERSLLTAEANAMPLQAGWQMQRHKSVFAARREVRCRRSSEEVG